MVRRDFGVENGPCSTLRYTRLKELVNRNFGSIDEGKLKAFLADLVNYPGSICRHDSGPASDSPTNKRFSTVASIIIRPEDGVLLLAEGNPCKKPFLELRI